MEKLNRRLIMLIVLISIMLLAGVGGYMWIRQSSQIASTVFWQAIETSLTTTGVTCTDKQGGGSQAVSLDLTSGSNLTSLTTLTQGATVVTTEGITTKTNQYTRYTDIKTAQKDSAGKPLDFKSVINVWSKQSLQSSSAPQLYDQIALGGCVVPLAHLNSSQARKLMTELKKGTIFRTNFATSKRGGSFFHPTRTYAVTIPPAPYIAFMKELATVTGSEVLDSLNAPGPVAQTATLTFTVQADKPQVRSIVDTSAARTITFSNYGVKPHIVAPTHTVSVSEIQTRLQAVR